MYFVYFRRCYRLSERRKLKDMTSTTYLFYNSSIFNESQYATVTAAGIASGARRCGTVHDIQNHKPTRLAILYSTIILGLIGCGLVLLWMACNRKVSPRFSHLSRVNAFILNLTFADFLVIAVAVIPQLVWEYVEREWTAGPVICRLVKFLQGFSMMASNYILVVIAIDRHQAIRAPLKESFPVNILFVVLLIAFLSIYAFDYKQSWIPDYPNHLKIVENVVLKN